MQKITKTKRPTPKEETTRDFNLLRFCLISKVYPRFVAKNNNNKTYALFSNLTQRLGHTWCDLKTSSTQANKMVSSMRFLANVTKWMSGKQVDRSVHERIKEQDRDIPLTRTKPPRFQNTLTRPGFSNLERG